MIDPVLCSSPPLEVSSALPTMAIGNETEAVDETFSVGITSRFFIIIIIIIFFFFFFFFFFLLQGFERRIRSSNFLFVGN